MEGTEIKYSKTHISEFAEYVGLGTYLTSQYGFYEYYPKKKNKYEWNKFLQKKSEALQFSFVG